VKLAHAGFACLLVAFAWLATSAGHAQETSPPAIVPSAQSPGPVASVTPSTIERDEPDLNKGVWVRGPNLPSPREDAAAAVIAGRIYVIGGFGPHNEQMDTTLVWEPQVAPGESTQQPERAGARLGVWTYAAQVPEPVDHAAVAADSSGIYIAGGRVENVVTNKFWRYDAGRDNWTEMPSMPVPRYGATMQQIDGKLYLIGGTASHGRDATSMLVYDIASGKWSTRTYALADTLIEPASTVLDDRLVLIGGRTESEFNVNSCDVYDPLRDRWTVCMDLHTARSDFGLSEVNGRLVAVGGDDLRYYQATQTMEISEPRLNGWYDGPWMPSPRHGMAQVTLGNVVWVIGGSTWTGTSPTSTVLRYISPLVKVKFHKGSG
jgi:hypothetical protein